MPTQENNLSNVISDEEKTHDVIDNDIENNNPQKTKKSSGFWLLIILILLLTAVSTAAAYYFWQQQQQQANAISSQQYSIQQLKNQLLTATETISNNTKALIDGAANSIELKKQIEQTQSISQQAIIIVNRNQRDWALAEVDYLLRIAHQRIAVAKDIDGAIAALKGADARLKQLGDLSLFNIRKQLAKDIGNLNAIHQADVNGISLALDQAIAYLPELPFKAIEDEVKIQFTENDAVQEPAIEDKTFVDSLLDTVKQIGDIKVHQRSIKAASSGEQQNQIEQLLRTYLLGARLAALRFDQIQFLHEIAQAQEILRLYYDEKDNRIEQLKKILSDYSVLQLSPDLPELTLAWTLLQTKIKTPSNKTVKSAVVKKQKQEAKK